MRRIDYRPGILRPCDAHNEPMTVELAINGLWRAASLYEACGCVGPDMETQEEAALAWGVDESKL